MQAGTLDAGSADETMEISYTVTCVGNGVEKVSPASPVTTVTVKAPAAPNPSNSNSSANATSTANGNATAGG